MTTKKIHDVFISYARKDGADLAKELHDELEKHGLSVWLDVYDIGPGEDWNRAIDGALDSVRCVLVILTPGAVESLQVMSEWNYALDKDTPVIPLLAETVDVPRRLRIINYVDIRTINYMEIIPSLVKRLKNPENAIVTNVRFKAPPPPPANSTENANPTTSLPEPEPEIEIDLSPSSFKSFYSRRDVLGLMLGVCLITGLIYGLIAANLFATISVIMLTTGTLILVVGIRNIHRYLTNNIIVFFSYLLASGDFQEISREAKQFYFSAFDTRNRTIAGVVYGFGAALVIIVLADRKQTDLESEIALFIFLFFVNFATGVALSGLINLFMMILQAGRTVEFDFWERNNASTQFVLNIGGRIAVFVSIYVAICINSAYFLEIPLNFAVHGYALFAGIMALASYLTPTIPLRRRFVKLKEDLLKKIDKDITRQHSILITSTSTIPVVNVDNSEDLDQQHENIEQLNQLREKVDRVELWPYSIRSALIISVVLVVTLSPILISLIFI